ncbi:MAG: hydantoin utilization protein A [Polyangiales bacterium]
MVAFLSGLLAGSLHVVSGPDHVAAVAPLAVNAPQAGRNLGALWGVGHGAGVLVWVVLAAAFQRLFGQELPSVALEALVGVALVALGLLNLRASARPHVHVHSHGPVAGHMPVPDGRAHVHFHVHAEGEHHGHDHHHDARFRGGATALAMGALHGSAGASHLLALLPTLGLPGLGALSYAAGYLLAGVLTMAGVGLAIARFAGVMPNAQRLRSVCAYLVIAIGACWLITALRELA